MSFLSSRAKMNNMKNLPLAISVAALLVAGAGLFISFKSGKNNELALLALQKEFKDYVAAHDAQPFTDPANAQSAQTMPPPLNIPTTSISFDRAEHNFGTITQGEKVRTKFKFTNTGTENLVISNAMGSWGCTVPSWPKEPIPPGKSGEIDVEFDSNGKEGEQSKNVTVEANTEPRQTVLTVKSNIKVKK